MVGSELGDSSCSSQWREMPSPQARDLGRENGSKEERSRESVCKDGAVGAISDELFQ